MSGKKFFMPFVFLFLIETGYGFPFEFKIYDKKTNFDHSFIYTLVQDQHHFLWIGTINGLYRYDGYTFKEFTKHQGLAENIVFSSFADSSGKLYFGHVQGGISVLVDEQFKSFRLSEETRPQVIRFIEHEDRVFALTRNHGIYLIGEDTTTGFLQQEFTNRVCTGIAVMDDNLYVSHNEGVSFIHLKQLLNKSGKLSEVGFLKGTPVAVMDKKKKEPGLWIATEDDGVYELGREHTLKKAVGASDISFNVDIFYEDDFGFWTGSKNRGIMKFVYEPVQNRYMIQYTINTETGFATSQISSILQDHESNFWIGSFDKGLIYLETLPVEYFEYKEFAFNEIHSVVPWKDDQFLTGTNRGLYLLKYDPEKNRWEAEQEEWMEKLKITISAIFIKDTDIFLGTIDNGIYVIDGKKRLREIFQNELLKNSRIRKITGDGAGNIWVSAGGTGIFRINEREKQTINHSTTSGFIHNEINDLFVDSQNSLWISMHSNGLSVLKGADQFFHLTKNGYLEAHDINSIREDQQGNIWIATDGKGLFKFNKQFQLLKNFTIEDNLVSNYCSFIVPDEKYLWVGYYDGVDRIGYDNSVVERYYSSSKNNFIPVANAASINKTGHICILSTTGFYLLSNNHKKLVTKTNQLVITGWKVNDRFVSKSEYMKRGKLYLAGNEKRIGFEFLSVSFENPAGIMYSYRLNHENTWSAPSNQRSVSFSSLSPGDYTFEVKSFPENNPLNFDTVSMKFRIAPPLYQKDWFVVLFFLSVVTASYFFNRQRTIRIVRQKNQFEKLVKERTQEILQQKEEIISTHEALKTAQTEIIRKNEQLENMNEKLENLVEERTEKLKSALNELEIFLYHASHDLKGPVARIRGLTMLAQLENNHHPMQSLNMMNDESRHLDFIIDKLSKIHSIISSPVQLSKIHIGEVMDHIIEKFRNWSEFSPIRWQFEYPSDLQIISDEYTLEFIMENLIENAIVFQNRDPEREKTIRIYAAVQPKKILFSIEDNGIGIPNEIRDRIFDMYFRGSLCSKGNGLGLYLVQKGIQKLNGKISFHSIPMEFTRFDIVIPRQRSENGAFSHFPTD